MALPRNGGGFGVVSAVCYCWREKCVGLKFPVKGLEMKYEESKKILHTECG